MTESLIDQQWQAVQNSVQSALEGNFPIEGRRNKMVLHNIIIDDKGADHSDIRSQEVAKVNGRTWGVPVYADISLIDKITGNEIDRNKIKLLTLPKPTQRYSYIVDGKERQIDNLWRLRSGVYAHIKQNGKLEAEFNLGTPLARQPRIYIPFDPEKKKFKLEHGDSGFSLYAVLKTLGVDDGDMKKAWGEQIYKENAISSAKVDKDVNKLYDKLSKKGIRSSGDSLKDKIGAITEAFHSAELLPDTTKATLGKPIDHVSGEALLLASQRILSVARGEIPQDDRDSLIFKELDSVEDFLGKKLSKYKTQRTILQKINHNIDRQVKVRDVISGDLFNKPISDFFSKDTLSGNPEQVNPLEMMVNHRSTTIISPEMGGIKNEQSVTAAMKLINPSHFGFLDPINTPESEKTGITLHLPLGVSKEGNEAKMRVYDLKEGKFRSVGPAEMHIENVVLPDQVKWRQQKPVPITSSVKMKDPKTHEIIHKPFSQGRFLVLTAQQLFDEATNLIPFLQNDQGNRTMTAARQATQAVSLHQREAPLVQVKTPSQYSFERIVGTDWAVESPVDGKIVALNKNAHNGHTDSIVIQGKDGVDRPPLQIYNHFPLNDSKSFIHATPNVKAGDSVKKNQVIADSNFTRDGTLALGTNLRVTYLPYKGYNFEDGIVISESAAAKLSSEHMHRKTIDINPERDFVDKKKFASWASTSSKKLTTSQLAKIGDDGIIHVGQKVQPGDLLVAAVGKRDLVGEVARAVGRLDKKMFAFEDKSITWDSQHEGEVVKVTRNPNGKGATVFVKTIEPAEIGDKIVGRHGNKCFDSETEVLTDQGWKKFSDLDKTENIATLNQATRHIEYQKPTAYVENYYHGKMYRFQGRRLDLLVTPNHNHFVRGRSDRSSVEGCWRLESSEACFGKQRVHLRTGEWIVSDDLLEVEIPGRPHEPHQHYKFAEPRKYDADDFLEFFGYWVTEGCIDIRGTVHVAQRKSVHPDIYEEIRSCIVRLGYEPSCYDDVLVFSDPRLVNWLKQFGKSRDKFIPREFLNLPQRQLRILADACFAGDGGVYYIEKDNHTRYELFTSSKRLADDYQELAFKLGMSANIKEAAEDRKVVRFSLNPEVWTTKDIRYGEKESWVDYDGMVNCVEVPNHIIYVRRNGIPVWSGNSIVCSILPDVDMPRIGGPEGTHTEVLMNPMGVPTRINLGQALETAASKIAIKTGKPYMVQNFDSKTPDYTQALVNQLKEHGLSDQDEMYDPHTGKKLGDALNGSQYIMKLKHQVEKKLAVRSFGPNYSIDRAPKGTGAEHPGQAIGQLEFYALLAHGARHNLREMATYKAEQHLGDTNNKQEHIEFWQRVQTGQPLPMPKIPFVYKKFEAMLTGLGIDVKKEGNELILQPLTDKGILNLSNGEIKDPGRVLRGKDAKELEKGLFDPKVTGGLPTDVGKGLKWCLDYHTKIITDRGILHIGTVVTQKLPVKVLSKNIKTGELEYKKIVNYWKNNTDKPLIGLYYNNTGYLEGFARGLHSIWCTPGHEIYSTEGIVHADLMECKSALIANLAQVNGATGLTTLPVTITKIDRSGTKTHSKSKVVYNIEVEDNHNYFANAILVGNSHIVLPEPVPNPIYVGTKQHPGPAVILSGLKFDEFESVARGQKSISILGKAGDRTGGQAISDILATIKVKPEIEKLRSEMPKLRGTNLDKANRKIKYLMAIDKLDMKPTDAYILKNVPVLPPIFRPIITMPDGSLRFDDINHYYKALGHINHQFETAPKELGDDGIKDLREDLYDLTRSLAGIPGGRPIYESNRQMKGLLDTIAGNSPKEGYFQKRLMKRRQELSMRSTIIPEPAMHLDHVGLPKDAAMELYKPFVIREMQGLGYSPVQALKEIKDGSTLAWKSLQLAMDKRPAWLKRDPALHKFSIMAFKPKITEGRAIKIHPLVTGGFNADFDGNCFIGESKIVLKFCDKDGKATDVSSVEKEFTMKFIAGTTIQLGYNNGVIVETEIQQVPYILETGRPDKNGAAVYDVPDGVFVLSYDHINNSPKFCQVKCITVENACKIAKASTRSGLEVTASTNESLCVYDHATQEIIDICPKDAVGKLSPIIRKIPTSGTYGDFEFGWMLGAFVSDGFINGNTIGIVKKLDAYRNRFYNAVSSYEGKYAKRTTFSEEHSIERGDSISGLSVKDHIYDVPKSSQLFNQCFIYPRAEGHASLSKKLPDVSGLTKEAQIGVLLGLLEGDGSLSISYGKKRPQVMASFGTSSEALVESVKSLCRFLGIRIGSTPYDPAEGRLQKHRAYIVTFSVPDLEKYAPTLLAKYCDPAITTPLQNLIENGSSKDDRDIVPVPEWVMNLCASTKGPITDNSMQRSLATIKSARKSGYYVSRDMAKTMLSYLTAGMFSEQSKRWYNLVYSEDIHWDVILEVSELGEATVYDLVVPETKVFAVNDGLVVWDTMSVFVPLSDDAVRETYKAFPSNNLFSSTTGGIMYSPEQESLMGLHLLSKWGTKINKEFSNFSEALKAKDNGSLKVNDVVKIGGHETTLGRALIAQHLPDTLKRNEHLNKQFLDPKFELTSKDIRILLEDVAKHDPKSFAFTVDNLKDLGNKYSYELGFSFGLKDLKVNKELRDGILKRSDDEVVKIKANNKLTPTQKHEQVVDVYTVATKEMVDKARPGFEESNNSMYRMVSSGSRGKMDQFRQMTIAPMLMKDGAGNTLATPVRKSYSEGLDIGDYWTSLHGARMGTLQRVEGTSEPGVLTKEVVNVVIPNMIVSHDCGTKEGIHLPIDDKDIYDRYLAAPIKLPNDQVIAAGTIVDANVTSTLKKHKIDRAVVRSPLKCAHGEGLCSVCYGLSENGVPHEIGTNIGVIAGQALGEPATQLAMNSFHCNHADSLVFVKQFGITNQLAISMEAFFDLIESPVEYMGDEQIKVVSGWEIYDGNWVQLTHVRRHAPERPMVLVGDGGFATICQDNHPIGVWENLVSCKGCGYHRLKKPSPASRGLKFYCPECGLHQEKIEVQIGRGGFLQPVEMEPGKWFLHRDLSPILNLPTDKEIVPLEGYQLPAYFVGMFLSEGCVLYRHSNRKVGEKKPYTTTITQNDGPIKDQIIKYLPSDYAVAGKANINSKCIVMHGLELGTKLIELFGRYSHSKALPPQFINYPLDWLAEVLCGIIDGDGSVKRCDDGPDQIVIDTTSFELAQQMIFMCARLGIAASILATSVVKLTRNQGYRVALRMTSHAVSKLNISLKVAGLEKLSPDQFPEVVGHKLLRIIKPVLYTKSFVYDVTTETGTLYVSGLKSHNTGGVAASRGGASVDKFTRLNNLLEIPKVLKNAAVLSRISGTVTKVERDMATNGWNVHVGDEPHFIPAQRLPVYNIDGEDRPLKVGIEVKKGRPISDGHIDPRELLHHTDIHTVQNHLTNELYNSVYKDERVRRRNIETVVRSLTNYTKISEPGDSDHLPGDFALRTVVEEHNRNLPPGSAPIIHHPILKGAKQMALDSHEDWMARLNFQELRNTIMEGASKGWRTNLHGTNPVSAYARGSEFGLPKDKGKGHLY